MGLGVGGQVHRPSRGARASSGCQSRFPLGVFMVFRCGVRGWCVSRPIQPDRPVRGHIPALTVGYALEIPPPPSAVGSSYRLQLLSAARRDLNRSPLVFRAARAGFPVLSEPVNVGSARTMLRGKLGCGGPASPPRMFSMFHAPLVTRHREFVKKRLCVYACTTRLHWWIWFVHGCTFSVFAGIRSFKKGRARAGRGGTDRGVMQCEGHSTLQRGARAAARCPQRVGRAPPQLRHA